MTPSRFPFRPTPRTPISLVFKSSNCARGHPPTCAGCPPERCGRGPAGAGYWQTDTYVKCVGACGVSQHVGTCRYLDDSSDDEAVVEKPKQSAAEKGRAVRNKHRDLARGAVRVNNIRLYEGAPVLALDKKHGPSSTDSRTRIPEPLTLPPPPSQFTSQFAEPARRTSSLLPPPTRP